MNATQVSNKKMQEFLDHSDDYCAIDHDGNLQAEVDDDTVCIVDCSADELGRHHDEEVNEMMVVFDRNGQNYYATTVRPWW